MASQRPHDHRSALDRRHLPDELQPRLNRNHVLRALDNLIDARLRFLEETGVAGAATARRELHATIVAVAERAGWKAHARTALTAARAQAAAAAAAWIDRALDLLADPECGAGCPASFHGALKYESWLHDRSPRAFAEVTGCGEQLLADYSEDRKRPGDEMRVRIEVLTAHLGFEPGYFWERRGSSGARAHLQGSPAAGPDRDAARHREKRALDKIIDARWRHREETQGAAAERRVAHEALMTRSRARALFRG